MAMTPQMKLSGFNKVAVGARISMSGSPTAQSGDLEGEIKPISTGKAEIVEVVINSVHP
jgi:cytochrome c-type biogenesis protein CcmH